MDIQKTALRLPKNLHLAILDEAKKNGVSMNAEIVQRLKSTFENSNDERIRALIREELAKINAQD